MQFTFCGDNSGATAPSTATLFPHSWTGNTLTLLSLPALTPSLSTLSAMAGPVVANSPVAAETMPTTHILLRTVALPLLSILAIPSPARRTWSTQYYKRAQWQRNQQPKRIIRYPDAAIAALGAENARIRPTMQSDRQWLFALRRL